MSNKELYEALIERAKIMDCLIAANEFADIDNAKLSDDVSADSIYEELKFIKEENQALVSSVIAANKYVCAYTKLKLLTH